MLPHEAVLMNSLRRMLTEVPQLEAKLGQWAGGPSASPGRGPQASATQLPPSPAHGEAAPRFASTLPSGMSLHASPLQIRTAKQGFSSPDCSCRSTAS